MHIDRCYCFQQTFADLKAVAEATGAQSVADLQAHVEFGHNCQLCHPYVRRMLRTGATAFDRVLRAEDEPAEGEPAEDAGEPTE
jgi:bacterioferritin-associated ferredoxin